MDTSLRISGGPQVQGPSGNAEVWHSNAIVQSALNDSPADRQVTSGVHDRHKEDYLDFVRSYRQPMIDFCDALLERAGRPLL
jgi:hypothetical protein